MAHPTVSDIKRLLREADDSGPKGYPVGTKTKRADGIWKKLKQGVWKLVKPTGGASAPTTSSPKSDPGSKPQAPKPSGTKQPSLFGDPQQTAPGKSAGYQPRASHPWSGKLNWPKKGETPEPGSLAKLSPNIHWYAKPSGPREPRDSKDLHRPHGDWTPERKKLHREILDHFLSKSQPVPPGKKPLVIMTMGIPASGKSSLLKGVNTSNFVHVDADAIKEMLPEYQEMVKKGDRNAANYVHAESGELTSRLRDRARDEHKNVIYDGTGKYLDSYLHRIKQFQEDGYHVQVLMPHLATDTAIERAKRRGEEGGRWVDPDIIRSNSYDVPRNFERIAKAADSAMLFDAEGSKPRLVWAKHRSGESTFDKQYMQKFWDKYGAKKQPDKTIISALATSQELRGIMEKIDPVVDPMEVARGVEKTAELELPPGPPKFAPNQGIIVQDEEAETPDES